VAWACCVLPTLGFVCVVARPGAAPCCRLRARWLGGSACLGRQRGTVHSALPLQVLPQLLVASRCREDSGAVRDGARCAVSTRHRLTRAILQYAFEAMACSARSIRRALGSSSGPGMPHVANSLSIATPQDALWLCLRCILHSIVPGVHMNNAELMRSLCAPTSCAGSAASTKHVNKLNQHGCNYTAVQWGTSAQQHHGTDEMHSAGPRALGATCRHARHSGGLLSYYFHSPAGLYT
jgi:hypothetical protein